MPPRRPVRHLTAYLLDAEVKEFAKAIAAADAVRIPLDRSARVDGVLYLRRTELDLPEWVDFVGPALQRMPSKETLASGGPSAALLIREKKHRRIFAFTYGFGLLLLKLDRVEGVWVEGNHQQRRSSAAAQHRPSHAGGASGPYETADEPERAAGDLRHRSGARHVAPL